MTFPPTIACIFIILFGGGCLCVGIIIGMTAAFDDWRARVEEFQRRRKRLVEMEMKREAAREPYWWLQDD